jgi:hypothetical protein
VSVSSKTTTPHLPARNNGFLTDSITEMRSLPLQLNGQVAGKQNVRSNMIDLQIIHVTNSGKPDAESLRCIRSQAANYWRAKKKLASRKSTFRTRELKPSTTRTKSSSIELLRPISPVGAARTDPFGSYPRPVTAYENFIIDHCEHPLASNPGPILVTRTLDSYMRSTPKCQIS